MAMPTIGAAEECDDVTEQPRAGPLRGLVAHVAAEQIERAMREVDVAHQTENQRESGGDEEIKSAKRYAVEKRVDEQQLLSEYPLESCRPWRQHEPQRENHRDRNDERGDRVISDPAAKRVAARGLLYGTLIAKVGDTEFASYSAGNLAEQRSIRVFDSLIFALSRMVAWLPLLAHHPRDSPVKRRRDADIGGKEVGKVAL